MALKDKELLQLMKTTTKAGLNKNTSHVFSWNNENFDYETLNKTLQVELNEMIGTPQLFRKNKNKFFDLVEQTIEDYLPKKVIEQYGMFAEIKQFKQNEKPIFIQKVTEASKRRAKRFITKVGLAGIYEVFKLDGKETEVKTSAYGGAAQIGLEEFLDGRVDWAAIVNIVMEGLDEIVYKEIAKALKAAVNTVKSSNKESSNSFDEVKMDRLLSVADSYGKSTIYCTFEFAATMIPSSEWASEQMKNDLWNNGYLANYKGHKVIVLAQSYEDESNTVKVMDPRTAFIIPDGASKPVKIAFEGATIVDEFKNYDRSREIQVYKKMGVAVEMTNNICVYVNTSL